MDASWGQLAGGGLSILVLREVFSFLRDRHGPHHKKLGGIEGSENWQNEVRVIVEGVVQEHVRETIELHRQLLESMNMTMKGMAGTMREMQKTQVDLNKDIYRQIANEEARQRYERGPGR